jgi:hypothetical protein
LNDREGTRKEAQSQLQNEMRQRNNKQHTTNNEKLKTQPPVQNKREQKKKTPNTTKREKNAQNRQQKSVERINTVIFAPTSKSGEGKKYSKSKPS